ncbi:DUF6221 family protein [Nonomuraea sp. NPDC023979]|uniref:DUF6221 family protein n=1 Tax=Nonomuraea sp. NPDC023979 TaxID=3154796 RepID=UPI0033F0A53A
MDELIAFVRARLDEDEQAARDAGNRHWLVQDNTIELYPEREDDGYMKWPTRADARHAANWEPARVLREVEAKRRMLGLAIMQVGKELGVSGVAHGYLALLLLAQPYAEHPDFQWWWNPWSS